MQIRDFNVQICWTLVFERNILSNKICRSSIYITRIHVMIFLKCKIFMKIFPVSFQILATDKIFKLCVTYRKERYYRTDVFSNELFLLDFPYFIQGVYRAINVTDYFLKKKYCRRKLIVKIR
jgi:hypothetical protein